MLIDFQMGIKKMVWDNLIYRIVDEIIPNHFKHMISFFFHLQ